MIGFIRLTLRKILIGNYQENPDLTAERINVLKDGLGEKGWRQEFLQEFLD
jgi:hypothetical protein